VKLQIGEVDTALVYSYGKSSPGRLRDILCLQLDPYYLAPLWPDSISLAALQARALLDAGKATEEDFAATASRARGEAASLDEPYVVAPLRKHDCPPITDGAVAVVLAADDAARRLSERPAWIRGIDHRIDVHYLGGRDLTTSPSAELAAAKAGVGSDKVDVAELHAPFSPQELILRDAIGIGRNGAVDVNPSGGALKANPMMAAGLIRLAEAAERVRDGRADRAVAHATSGPCLQQNLVCVLEGD
jgi:acetyl-CoA acetyltransferase